MAAKKTEEEWRVITFLKNVVPHNPVHRAAVYRALQFLYSRQTSQEQSAAATVVDNGEGFNGFDAPFLSDVAKRAKQYGSLTPNQTEVIARKLIKYAKQLTDLSQMNPRKPVQAQLPSMPVPNAADAAKKLARQILGKKS